MSEVTSRLSSSARWQVKKYKGGYPQTPDDLPYEIEEGGDGIPTTKKILNPITREYEDAPDERRS